MDQLITLHHGIMPFRLCAQWGFEDTITFFNLRFFLIHENVHTFNIVESRHLSMFGAIGFSPFFSLFPHFFDIIVPTDTSQFIYFCLHLFLFILNLNFYCFNRHGENLNTEDITKIAKCFKDDLTLDNISRPQLVNICKYMGIKPYGADAFLRYQVRDMWKF